ncbi:peptide ABC transporter substrate-binding protein [Enterococcus sp. AZ101]|uniref:peptide ABC transporter substrate-binding protein n=1 Tax=Enterococcus sp. AZ101 TaxID=2774742 RepID=UPI003D2A84B1
MKIRKSKILLVSAVLLTLAGCSGGKDAATKEEQVLRVGIDSELSTADVSLTMDNTACSVMSQVGEGLFSFDEKGEAVPALATDKVEPSKDGLTYTFTIRDNAKWSNGDPIKAKDFEYSWKRTVDPETASPQAYYFEGIKNYKAIANGEKNKSELGVKAVDDLTLEVNLEYPMSYFQQLLAVPAFFPLNEKFVEKTGKEYGTTAEDTLYNGPFTMEGWDGTNNTWSYVKNKEYWDKDAVKLDKVEAQVIKEITTAKNLFDDGQLDEVKITGEIVAQEKGNEALKIREVPGTYYIQLNTKKDIFANLNARKAIALSLDSKKLAENVLNDGSKKALGFVPTGFINQASEKDFAEEVGDINPTDEAKAKELWASAKKELGIEKTEVTILCSDSENAKKISEYIQGSLDKTLDGLTVNVSAVPFNNRLEKSRSGDFDIVLGGWTPVYADPIDFLSLLQTENSNNFGKWSSTEYDQLLSEANKTYANDYEKRWDVMKKADQLIAEEVPLVSLYQLSEAYLINDRVKELPFGPLGSVYYKNVYIEE